MRIELLIVGDELLTGQTDPYPTEIINLIRSKGAHVSRITIVVDDLDSIVGELEAIERNGAALVIVTGGLGPTLDDVTRHAVARYLGEELVLDPDAVAWLREGFAIRHGKDVGPRKESWLMAMVPRGSRALWNPVGIAFGILAQKGGMRIACLPGFPKEMLGMFREHVLSLIEADGIFEKEIWVRRGESEMEPLFQIIVKEFSVRVSSLPKEDWRERGNLVVIKGEREEVERAAQRFAQLLSSEFAAE
ncbi:MAG: competence/damage-inducible protein A [Methanomassiliicoccales archaeon]|nr:competence/damage-inducible protein A [Methanomassiliicoccales archaeon]